MQDTGTLAEEPAPELIALEDGEDEVNLQPTLRLPPTESLDNASLHKPLPFNLTGFQNGTMIIIGAGFCNHHPHSHHMKREDEYPRCATWSLERVRVEARHEDEEERFMYTLHFIGSTRAGPFRARRGWNGKLTDQYGQFRHAHFLLSLAAACRA